MANIGLIAMSAKPYHAGHDGLVRWAANENDIVYLFVSLSDRKRPGEVPILGKDMDLIWKSQIEPSLPGNVKVDYGGSPVAKIYKILENANLDGSTDTFTVYSDPVDLAQNYPEASMNKYAGDIWQQGQIVLTPIDRSMTVNVSGTKMRQYLSSGDKDAFIANLPSQIDGQAVWNILSQSKNVPDKPKKSTRKTKSENLLRTYIKTLLG